MIDSYTGESFRSVASLIRAVDAARPGHAGRPHHSRSQSPREVRVRPAFLAAKIYHV